MTLEKASIHWHTKQIKNMYVNGKIDCEHIVQRSYVWEISRKSALIESIILGYPIPPIFTKRVEEDGDKKYVILDGKQRLSTITEYLSDSFALTPLPPVTYLDEEHNEYKTYDMSNHKFSQLPEALKDIIGTTTLNVTCFDNLTKEEEREMFKRLNAGKPLSTKSRVLASCKDIEGLLDIGSHLLFEEMLTTKAKANKNQVSLVMKAWCMLNQNIENISFESKVFNPMLEEIAITEEEKEDLVKLFDFIVDTHNCLVNRDSKDKKVAKKLYTETHLISLVPFFKKALEEEISEELFADWVSGFYNMNSGASIAEQYNVACMGGSAKNANITIRHNELEKSYNEFFKQDNMTE